MMTSSFEIQKSSGDKVLFSLEQLRDSLKKSGADHNTVESIIEVIINELYAGISTKEIYNRAFALLKKEGRLYASRYKLKRAIYELGPTGFPFEKFVAAVLKYSGYDTEVSVIYKGLCVSHEVDVKAVKNKKVTLIECEFHSNEGINCNVKTPLYINSRFKDIRDNWENNYENENELAQGWLVTNTRFTDDALQYGKCAGLYLLSWDFPKNHSLKDRVERLGLYPITVSTLLSNREKQFLLSRDVILCRDLSDDDFYLDHLGISESRKEKILEEFKLLSLGYDGDVV